MVVGFIYALKWHSNYSEPADGGPKVRAEIFVPTEPGQGATGTPEALLRMKTIGDGYCVTVSALETPMVVWPVERKIAHRQRLLKNRIEKKYPMFAEQMIDDAIRAKPEYYVDGKDDYAEEREKLLDYYARKYAFFTSNPGRLIVGGWECCE